jgi:hypothetical protein
MGPMSCPHCGVVGQPAETYTDSEGQEIALASSTLIGFDPFRDDQGREHRHNPNWFRMQMRCAAGHVWVRQWLTPCWCGWPQSSEEGETQ